MSEDIFRKKSLEKVKTPENLDDYIQVSNPGVWLLLVSIIALLAGVCIWGVFGHINSTVDVGILADNEFTVCYIAEADLFSVREGMTVKFNGMEAVITEISKNGDEGYICALQSEQPIPIGYYNGKIIVRSYQPISFVLN